VYANRGHMGWSDVEATPSAQDITLTPEQLASGDPIPLKCVMPVLLNPTVPGHQPHGGAALRHAAHTLAAGQRGPHPPQVRCACAADPQHFGLSISRTGVLPCGMLLTPEQLASGDPIPLKCVVPVLLTHKFLGYPSAAWECCPVACSH